MIILIILNQTIHELHKIFLIHKTLQHKIYLYKMKSKIQKKEFAEWEMVYEGKYYGTLKSELKRIWLLNKVPVLDIDVKGALHIQQQYPENTMSIFVDPPSVEELKKRLSPSK